jgi:hypothetical protein
LSEAQTASLLTLSVPDGSDTHSAGPHALELNSPNDRTVAVDSAGAARTIKTIEREELANYEAPGRVGIEAFRSCRPECQPNTNHNRAACNHMIRPPADHQGHYSQNTKRCATTFLMKG